MWFALISPNYPQTSAVLPSYSQTSNKVCEIEAQNVEGENEFQLGRENWKGFLEEMPFDLRLER